MIDTIYLHMGAHKTGTTSIQEHLGGVRHLLDHHGWLYPSFDFFGTHEYNHSLPLMYIIFGSERNANSRRNPPESLSKLRQQRFLEQFRVQIDRFQGNKLILSGEEWGRLSLDEMAGLRDFLKEVFPALHTIKVYYVMRHPVAHKTSLYQQVVKTSTTFRLALDDILSPRFSFVQTLERASAVFGREHVSALRYEDLVRAPGGLVEAFLKHMDPWIPMAQYPDIFSNESITMEAARLADGLHERFAGFVDGVENPRLTGFLPHELHRIPGRRFAIDSQLAHRFWMYAHEDANRACRAFGLPEYVYEPLPDPDLSRLWEADTIDYLSGMLPGVQPEVRAVALQVVKSEYRALGRLFSPEKRQYIEQFLTSQGIDLHPVRTWFRRQRQGWARAEAPEPPEPIVEDLEAVRAVLSSDPLFDPQYYTERNPDVAASDMDPLTHFIRHGWRERRNPSKGFYTHGYLTLFPDVARAGINPLYHYLTQGRGEGRVPGYSLDTVYRYTAPVRTADTDRQLQALGQAVQFSVLVPVYNIDPQWLDAAVQSVVGQWYPHWELILVDDGSTNPDTLAYLESLSHPSIVVQRQSENGGISRATNAALALASGDYIALLDHDDLLTPDALFEIALAISEHRPDVLYTDEDKVTTDGHFEDPHFKPGYSPAFLLGINYICHLLVVRRALALSVGGFTPGLEGAQDHDFVLRCVEQTRAIHHIPKILYHWRKLPDSTAVVSKWHALESGRYAVQHALARRGLTGYAAHYRFRMGYPVFYDIQGSPLVSILIPFKDQVDALTACIEAILSRSTYTNFEIIGLDNDSRDPATHAAMSRCSQADARVRFVAAPGPFNYAQLNNSAVAEHARGTYVVLMNSDVEVITPNWIELLLGHAQQPDVGAVGAKLLYPADTIQHAGVIIGGEAIAFHAHKHLPAAHPGYIYRLQLAHDVSAVTGALLMVRKDLYETVGGMDAINLPIAYNDIDFCLRLREAGYRNIVEPRGVAYHRESLTRTPDPQRESDARTYFLARHARILAEGDPYYNPNLALWVEDFRLSHESPYAYVPEAPC